jgi:indolepyruvate ferredoxin oxidoreductase beta subunit
MKRSFDVLIVGVGGQGIILTSNVLGEACLIEGKPVKGAETHGMAQRGGSVETHIRIGGEFGPLVPLGGADLLIALELLEALRYRHYLRPEGAMVASSQIIVPTSVYTQNAAVPTLQTVESSLSDLRPCLIDAPALAIEAGSVLAQNIVLLGAASISMPLSEDSLREAVRRCVPKKTIEINEKAFSLGRLAGERCRSATDKQ